MESNPPANPGHITFDCLFHNDQGGPYLRYVNNKMRRAAAVPIDADLEVEIRAQQQRTADRWPGQHPHLVPQLKGNAGGQRPLSYYSYRGMLNSWLALCQVHDGQGAPVHLTPHQWRHTFACRLINRDVPQEVVRVLLDHESTQMTAHYTPHSRGRGHSGFYAEFCIEATSQAR